MRVYVSATYRDLHRHRAAAAQVLRRMGHQVIGMEEYVAEGRRPLQRCLQDVSEAEAYVGIFAWRYGSVPTSGTAPPDLPPGTTYGTTSVTEFELRQAIRDGKKPVLIFLLDPEADWPSTQFDAVTGEGDGGARIMQLREEVGEKYLVSHFRTPESLAGLVSAAIYRVEMSNRLKLDSLEIEASFNQPFVRNGPVEDSTLMEITRVIAGPQEIDALKVNLGNGRDWWMTRLYFVSSLAADLREIEVTVFVGEDELFVGVVDPRIVVERLARHDPRLLRYERALGRNQAASPDVETDIHRRATVWRTTMKGEEDANPVFVGQRELRRWLAPYMIEHAIEWDARGNAAIQVQRLLDWPLRFVPVTEGQRFKRVVDKQNLTEQVARLFVREQVVRAMSTV
jgi:hypothetical protein